MKKPKAGRPKRRQYSIHFKNPKSGKEGHYTLSATGERKAKGLFTKYTKGLLKILGVKQPIPSKGSE